MYIILEFTSFQKHNINTISYNNHKLKMRFSQNRHFQHAGALQRPIDFYKSGRNGKKIQFVKL